MVADVVGWLPAQQPRPIWATADVGYTHACATRTDHTLWCWGFDDSENILAQTPMRVGTTNTWTAVTMAFDHACATQTDNTLWCWGANGFGELGLGDTTDRWAPNPLP